MYIGYTPLLLFFGLMPNHSGFKWKLTTSEVFYKEKSNKKVSNDKNNSKSLYCNCVRGIEPVTLVLDQVAPQIYY